MAVGQQVEAWRARVAEAMQAWEGEGYRVQRLVNLLNQETPVDPESVLREFVGDIERLKLLEAEAAELEPALAGNSVFRDPDSVEAAQKQVDQARQGTLPPPGPSQHWLLADLAEGSGTRLALRAIHDVVARPGAAYNPVVFVGEPGVGKTHFLHALGNELAARPDAVVACLETSDFTDELIKAIEKDRVNWWRARYRRVTALLLDDIQLLAGKERTQEELFWLFNLLVESGRQLAFTCVSPLSELKGIDARLLTRLEGGLVVELPSPDREVRLAVVAPDDRSGHGSGGDRGPGHLPRRPARWTRCAPSRAWCSGCSTPPRPSRSHPPRPWPGGFSRGRPPQAPRRSVGTRTSGVVTPLAGIKSREKVVWDWPDSVDRMIEELR